MIRDGSCTPRLLGSEMVLVGGLSPPPLAAVVVVAADAIAGDVIEPPPACAPVDAITDPVTTMAPSDSPTSARRNPRLLPVRRPPINCPSAPVRLVDPISSSLDLLLLVPRAREYTH